MVPELLGATMTNLQGHNRPEDHVSRCFQYFFLRYNPYIQDDQVPQKGIIENSGKCAWNYSIHEREVERLSSAMTNRQSWRLVGEPTWRNFSFPAEQ